MTPLRKIPLTTAGKGSNLSNGVSGVPENLPRHEPPKLLVILPLYIPFPGGAEKSTHERVRRLAAAGWSIDILIAPNPYQSSSIHADLAAVDFQIAIFYSMEGIKITKPRTKRDFYYYFRRYSAAANVIFFSRANLLRRFYGFAIDRKLNPLRYKTMYFVHDLDPDDYFEAAFVVANSTATLINIPETPSSRRLLLKPLISPTPQRHNQRRFVTIINPDLLKGGDIFAAVARSLPTIDFLAQLGSAMPVEELNGISNVEIRRPVTDMSDVYAETSILLVPSRRESFGRVAVEAALAGCLVLVHRVDGLSEVPLPQYSFVDGLDSVEWTQEVLKLVNTDDAELQLLRNETMRSAQSYNPGWEQFSATLSAMLS